MTQQEWMHTTPEWERVKEALDMWRKARDPLVRVERWADAKAAMLVWRQASREALR